MKNKITKFFKKLPLIAVLLFAIGSTAYSASSTIWGASHVSTLTTNRLPVDTSNVSGAGYNSIGDILGLVNGDCTIDTTTALIQCNKSGGVGFATIATSGSASDLVTGTVPAARLPNPSATTLGGIQSFTAQGSKWINAISTSGVPSATQPNDSDLAFTDIVTNNATTTKHGFLKKLPNDAAQYMDGTGAWSSPSAFTSIDFTGDGTVLSSTPSAGPHMAASLASAAAKTILGNATAGSAAPTYTTAPVVSGAMTANTFTSVVATGTAPFTVSSTTPVTNLAIGGNAATATILATTRSIYGNNFDGSAALAQVIASTYGGTGNGFTKFSGPTTAEKTFTLPDANATLLYSGGAGGTPSAITLTNGTGLPLAGLATQATNTVVGNATSGSASPTALAVGSCSTAGSALIWTTNTGFGCNTSITASSATSATTATTATNATNTAITDDTTTNATMYPTWVTTASSNQAQKVSSTKLTFNPSTGTLTATALAGPLTGNATTATTLATTRAIYGNNFDGSAALAQVIASTYGGTGNGFTKISGPTTSERTKTMRDASDTVLELGGSYTPTGTYTNMILATPNLGTPSALVLTNATGLPYAGGGTGASSFTNHGVVTAGASALTTVAPSTSGNVLTSNGTDWTSAAPAAGSSTITSIASGSLPAAATLDITSIPATYSELILVIEGASSNTATRGLQVTANLGGGLGTDQQIWEQIANVTVTHNSGTRMWTEITQTAAQISSCIIHFPAYQNGIGKSYYGRCNVLETSGTNWSATAANVINFRGAFYTSGAGLITGALTGLRIKWDASGNFDAGTYALYGAP